MLYLIIHIQIHIGSKWFYLFYFLRESCELILPTDRLADRKIYF